MKTFMKTCGITAAIFLFVGLTMVSIAAAVKGPDLVRNITGTLQSQLMLQDIPQVEQYVPDWLTEEWLESVRSAYERE